MHTSRRATSAGMSSYLLGQKDHYAEDREAADAITAVLPEAPAMIRASRRWQACTVRRMAGRGIRQFIDLGCGYPAPGTADDELMPVHEVAWDAGITAGQTLYVDADGEAADAAWLMAEQTPGTGAVCADMADPGAVLGSDAGKELLDLREPTGLVFGLSLHFMSSEAAREVIAAWAEVVAPDSLIAVTVPRIADPGVWEKVRVECPGEVHNFTEAEVCGLFDGLTMLPPGVGPVEWGAAGQVRGSAYVAGGIGVKR